MLNAEQVSHLRLMTQTEGWKSVFEPWLKLTGNELIKFMLMTPTQRPKPWDTTPDDILRGEIKRIEYILIWTANQLKVEDHNRFVDELHDERENGTPEAAVAP